MPNGCDKCWAEFKGWLKAFTPLESLLTLLEAILLVLFLLLLIFVVIHFITCRIYLKHVDVPTTTPEDTTEDAEHFNTTLPYPTTRTKRVTCTYTPQGTEVGEVVFLKKSNVTKSMQTTKSMGETTKSMEETTKSMEETTKSMDETTDPTGVVTVDPSESFDIDTSIEDGNAVISPDETDGEIADDDEKSVVLALVKVRPLTFGCILTVVSEYWTVTAASCIESIEEVDSLDNFVILDNYGEEIAGHSHGVSDVRVHPLYEGRNRSYDLALLQAERGLGRRPVRLASLLDYFRVTVGDRAEILGFGHFRLIDNSATGKRVHSAVVHFLPVRHCTPPEFKQRLLLPMDPVTHGRCGLAPLCLGVLYSRGMACNFCAGSPLMLGSTLLGVMADNDQCGAACEPSLYVNMAAVRDWLGMVIAS